jgi:sirohydrochlorin cobaltochelatase
VHRVLGEPVDHPKSASTPTMNSPQLQPGILLFAHGARDARWAEPFQRVAARMRVEAPQLPLELAFLEFMAPDLPEAARRLAAHGATSIQVIPLFFGAGGHLRTGVPELVARARTELPGVRIEVAPAAGEDPGVVAALASYALQCAERARAASPPASAPTPRN